MIEQPFVVALARSGDQAVRNLIRGDRNSADAFLFVIVQDSDEAERLMHNWQRKARGGWRRLLSYEPQIAARAGVLAKVDQP